MAHSGVIPKGTLLMQGFFGKGEGTFFAPNQCDLVGVVSYFFRRGVLAKLKLIRWMNLSLVVFALTL